MANEDKYNLYFQVESRSIVINGSFTPSIYQPYWLQSKNIVGVQEAESADIKIIMPNVCQFVIGGWLEFTCTLDRMQLITRQKPYFQNLRDVASQIFHVHSQVPVNSMGMNYIHSFGMRDEEHYFEIGNNIAKLNNWSGILNNPKLMKIDLNSDIDANGCVTSINVRQADNVLKINHGVEFAINDHFALKNNGLGADVYRILESHYDFYADKAKEISVKTISTFI